MSIRNRPKLSLKLSRDQVKRPLKAAMVGDVPPVISPRFLSKVTQKIGAGVKLSLETMDSWKLGTIAEKMVGAGVTSNEIACFNFYKCFDFCVDDMIDDRPEYQPFMMKCEFLKEIEGDRIWYHSEIISSENIVKSYSGLIQAADIDSAVFLMTEDMRIAGHFATRLVSFIHRSQTRINIKRLKEAEFLQYSMTQKWVGESCYVALVKLNDDGNAISARKLSERIPNEHKHKNRFPAKASSASTPQMRYDEAPAAHSVSSRELPADHPFAIIG